MLETFFYPPGPPLPMLGQVPADTEEIKKQSHAFQLSLMDEQVHVLHGAPLSHIGQLPADPAWKPPYIVLD